MENMKVFVNKKPSGKRRLARFSVKQQSDHELGWIHKQELPISLMYRRSKPKPASDLLCLKV